MKPGPVLALGCALALSACNTIRPILGGEANRPAELSGRLLLADSNVKANNQTALRVQAMPDPSARIPGELVVGLEPGRAPEDLLIGLPGFLGWRASSPTVIVVQVQPGLEEAVYGALEGQPGVTSVDFNQRVRSLATPNDPSFSLQSNLGLIGMPAAWDVQRGTANVLVAVIDDGYDSSVADMTGRISLPTPPAGFYLDPGDLDNNPQTYAGSSRHGAQVASIIAAATNNGTGIAGVTWQGVQVVPIKVYNASGEASLASLAAGIDTAVRLGVRVINISLGVENASKKCDPNAGSSVVDTALKNAFEKGILVVVSTGNDSGTTVCYPASNRYVMAVGSVDQSKARSSFSTHGPGIDIVAPGSNVLALNRTGPLRVSGTSFSAPTVAGVAALLASQGEFSPDVIFAKLVGSSEDLGSSGYDTDFGNGLVRADRALATTNTGPSAALRISVKQGGTVVKTITSTFKTGRNTGAYALTDLASGTYTIRAHVDTNGNGTENPGDYVGERSISYDGGAMYGRDITLERVP